MTYYNFVNNFLIYTYYHIDIQNDSKLFKIILKFKSTDARSHINTNLSTESCSQIKPMHSLIIIIHCSAQCTLVCFNCMWFQTENTMH